MKVDKILGSIIRIPICLILLAGTPITFILSLGITLSFKDSWEITKERILLNVKELILLK